jgi:Domain of unknown function (DUF5122) beta-propeller
VLRVTSAGELDAESGFGDGGVATFDFGDGNNDWIRDIAIQEDGKIAVAGSLSGSGHSDLFAARLNQDGTLDDDSDGSGFSGDGIARVDWSERNNYATA